MKAASRSITMSFQWHEDRIFALESRNGDPRGGEQMNTEAITSIKGIGEKTARLFQQLGVQTVEDMLHYYPRAYDAFLPPQPVSELAPETVAAVEGVLTKTADVLPYGRMKVTAAALRDISGLLTLTWYNMPYLKSALRSGERFVFRGRVVKKKGAYGHGAAAYVHPRGVRRSGEFHAARLRPDKGPGE